MNFFRYDLTTNDCCISMNDLRKICHELLLTFESGQENIAIIDREEDEILFMKEDHQITCKENFFLKCITYWEEM